MRGVSSGTPAFKLLRPIAADPWHGVRYACVGIKHIEVDCAVDSAAPGWYVICCHSLCRQDVIRDSARKEFEARSQEKNPETV